MKSMRKIKKRANVTIIKVENGIVYYSDGTKAKCHGRKTNKSVNLDLEK